MHSNSGVDLGLLIFEYIGSNDTGRILLEILNTSLAQSLYHRRVTFCRAFVHPAIALCESLWSTFIRDISLAYFALRMAICAPAFAVSSLCQRLHPTESGQRPSWILALVSCSRATIFSTDEIRGELISCFCRLSNSLTIASILRRRPLFLFFSLSLCVSTLLGRERLGFRRSCAGELGSVVIEM
jgi:hypothetical protein